MQRTLSWDGKLELCGIHLVSIINVKYIISTIVPSIIIFVHIHKPSDLQNFSCEYPMEGLSWTDGYSMEWSRIIFQQRFKSISAHCSCNISALVVVQENKLSLGRL